MFEPSDEFCGILFAYRKTAGQMRTNIWGLPKVIFIEICFGSIGIWESGSLERLL